MKPLPFKQFIHYSQMWSKMHACSAFEYTYLCFSISLPIKVHFSIKTRHRLKNSHLVGQCLDVLDPIPWGILQENRGLISLHSFLWRHSHQNHVHKLAVGGCLCWGGGQEGNSGAGATGLPTLLHNSHLQLIFLHLSIVSRCEMLYSYQWTEVIFKSTSLEQFFFLYN